MLRQIANYCPIISRNTLVRPSTSIESIWNTILLHCGFQVTGTGAHDVTSIHLEPNVRPLDLFQRLMAFVKGNLLRSNGISHQGETLTEDEEMTPILENFVVFIWLRLIYPELPKLVNTNLCSQTFASIKPDAFQALPSPLNKIWASYDVKIMHTAASSLCRPSSYRWPQWLSHHDKSCPLCKQSSHSNHQHLLSECSFFPEHEWKISPRYVKL